MMVFILIMMVIIGAIIGGVTNSIAIKMLFRPYREIYIGSWRVPFTPGLIPKRRQELAEQLGKLVVTHLLTAEGLKKQLEQSAFLTEITEWLQREAIHVCKSEESLASLAEKWLGIKNSKRLLDAKVESWLDERLQTTIAQIKPMQLKALLPETVDKKMDGYIPIVTEVLVEKAKTYFQSEEGIEKLGNMVDRFLMGRGALGGMISMFLGNERLADKLQPEIIKMLEDKGTHEMIEAFLRQEWVKLKQLRIEELDEHIELESIVAFMKAKLKANIPTDYIEKPLSQWSQLVEAPIINDVIPIGVAKIGQAISNELVTILQKLKLEEVVKNEVAEFSVQRLEEMVLSISRKELKLITYLGALLGGFIGFFQGLIVLFIG